MPVWLQVTLAIGVPVLTVSASAVVTYITKYAPDAQAARQQFAAVGLRVLKWIGVMLMIGGLISNLLSPEPIKRVEVFLICLQIVGLASLGLIALFNRMSDVLEQVVRLMKEHNESAGHHLDVTRGVLGSIRGVATEVEKNKSSPQSPPDSGQAS